MFVIGIREGDGYLIVFALNNQGSLSEAETIHSKIKRILEDQNAEDIPIVLVGNKCDLPADQRQVISAFCFLFNILFFCFFILCTCFPVFPLFFSLFYCGFLHLKKKDGLFGFFFVCNYAISQLKLVGARKYTQTSKGKNYPTTFTKTRKKIKIKIKIMLDRYYENREKRWQHKCEQDILKHQPRKKST